MVQEVLSTGWHDHKAWADEASRSYDDQSTDLIRQALLIRSFSSMQGQANYTWCDS